MNPTTKRIIRWLIAVFMLVTADSTFAGQIIYVDDDGPTDFNNIQAAINESNHGDTIIVYPGTYIENINFNGKNITLKSAEPTNLEIVQNTTIEGVVYFRGTEDPTCLLSGFNIDGYIVGSYSSGPTHATISHCLLGAVFTPCAPAISACDGTINNCIIEPVYYVCLAEIPEIWECHGLIENCTIIGRIEVCEGGTCTLRNCIMPIIHVTVYRGATLNVSYCDVEGGLADIQSVGTVNWGPGNIDADPLFVELAHRDANGIWIEADYHLLPGSPCIDAGDPNYPYNPNETDLDGRPRIIGGRIDMGAFEFGSVHWYVDDDANGANDGSSWADAFNYLQDALSAAWPGDEVRVAQSIYRPDQGNGITPGDRTATFQLVNGVTLKGGYAGAGTPDPDARNITAYKTILNGDLNSDDTKIANPKDLLDEPTLADNSYNVVTGSGTEPNAVLDGFTVSAGRGGSGAGLYNYSGSPTLTNCTFIANAGDLGGAMRNSHSNPVIINCIFVGNAASHGGAMYNWRSSPIITNCTFSDNFAGYKGGAINNSAHGNPTVTNCILYNNSDNTGMGESAQIHNTQYASPVVDYSCIQGWTGNMGGTGNIGDNPLFLDPDGADNVICTEDDNFRLLPGSPCIDAGDNSALPASILTDLDGDPRIANGIVDMGAYEGPTYGFLLSTQSLTVQEGRTATFTVALTMDPLGTVEVTVAPQSGDADIFVQYGASLTFDSSNYSYPQTVTLTAAEDQDYLNSKTLIWISAPQLFTAGLTATEWDNDTPEVIYVDWTASGANNGLSWTDAFPDLKEALAVVAGVPQIHEIRVAQGLYTPKQALPGDRRATFRLINDLTIKGGYAGLGERDHDARDIKLYETILSGDLNSDDGPDFANNDENSYHVLTSSDTDATAVLDGFTITAGNADYYSKHYSKGAGMYNDGGCPTLTNCTFSKNSALTGGGIYNNSNPTLTNCTFTCNLAGDGGGMFNENSSPTLKNCTFSENTAVEDEGSFGGGMYNANSSPVLTNCTFTRNFADVLIPDHGGGEGGGMYNEESSPTLTNCTFSGNTARCHGGGMGNRSKSSPLLKNCIFTGNSAAGSWGRWGEGGGIYNHYQCSPVLINCTFSANSAITGGALYSSYNCSPTLTNCILWDDTLGEINGTSVVNYSDVQGGWPGEGNINADPCFAESGYWDPNNTPDDTSDDFWVHGDYHLKSEGWRWDGSRQRWHYDETTSRCIDAGNPSSPLSEEPISLPEDPNNIWAENIRINMGAYGGTPEASIPPYHWALLADMTNDGLVDFRDYAAQADDWLNPGDSLPGDLNRDSVIDIPDLALIAGDWLKATSWHE